MRGTFKIEKPEDIDLTLTVTMSLREWRVLKDQMTSDHPSWKLRGLIGDAVRKAEQCLPLAERAGAD
jgi:hypothetical protein